MMHPAARSSPRPEFRRGHRGPGAFDLIVVAASTGALSALNEILPALPADFPVALAVVLHRSAQAPSVLDRILGRRTALRVKLAEPDEPIRPGAVYLAPPDRHLVVNPDRTFSLADGRRIHFLHSSADPLFTSAAAVFGHRLLAVVLTGAGSDGSDGARSVLDGGGIVIAQSEESSRAASMPRSAVRTGAVRYVLPLSEIGPLLVRLVYRGVPDVLPEARPSA